MLPCSHHMLWFCAKCVQFHELQSLDEKFSIEILTVHCMFSLALSASISHPPSCCTFTGILKALEECNELNLTSAGQTEVSSLKKHFGSFTALPMSAIWFKVFVIDRTNKILQTRKITIVVEERNLEEILKNLSGLCDWWSCA